MQTSETDTIESAQPKILVLGATGGTGRLIVSQAVARGYDVTVLVRSAEKASDLKGAKLIVGDARDETALRAGAQRPRRGRQRIGHTGQPVPRGDASLDRDARTRERDEGRASLSPGLHHGDGRRRQRGARRFCFRQPHFSAAAAQSVCRQGSSGRDRQRQRTRLGSRSPIGPERQVRSRHVPGADGSLRRSMEEASRAKTLRCSSWTSYARMPGCIALR